MRAGVLPGSINQGKPVFVLQVGSDIICRCVCGGGGGGRGEGFMSLQDFILLIFTSFSAWKWLQMFSFVAPSEVVMVH